MSDLLEGTEFDRRLSACAEQLTDREYRELVLEYCQRYQEVYWFEQLENAFAYLTLTDHDREQLQSDLPDVRSQVQEAVGEYFESLNEVATAVYRLLDDTPFSSIDARTCIAHVWNAHACNEHPEEFRCREDRVLCELLSRISK